MCISWTSFYGHVWAGLLDNFITSLCWKSSIYNTSHRSIKATLKSIFLTFPPGGIHEPPTLKCVFYPNWILIKCSHFDSDNLSRRVWLILSHRLTQQRMKEFISLITRRQKTKSIKNWEYSCQTIHHSYFVLFYCLQNKSVSIGRTNKN